MPKTPDQPLLAALLDSWDRNNTILVNLLRLIPLDALELKPTDTSPSIAQHFTHIHYVRLIFLSEDAPTFAKEIPETEWRSEGDPGRIAQMLNESAMAVRDAIEDSVTTGTAMQQHFDHPILFLQHMIWHEGYHHGQIKLALKIAGYPLSDEEAGVVTWQVWMNKTPPRQPA